MKAVDSSKMLLPIYKSIWQHITGNSNPSHRVLSSTMQCHLWVGWPTPPILCTREVRSLQSTGVCACVCGGYQSVCIAHYTSPWWRGQRQFFTLCEFYSTLAWMITHAYFTAFSSYESLTEHMTGHMNHIAHETETCCNPPTTQFYRRLKKLDISLIDEIKHVM
jgi:hypothetical protein